MMDLNKIYELSAGVEHHLNKLEEFTDALREVHYSLRSIQESQEAKYLWELQQLRREVAEMRHTLRKYGLPEANEYERKLSEIREMIDGDWPQAVDPAAVCLTEDQQRTRAENILLLIISEYIKDQKFLDFGCGKEGYVVWAGQTQGAKLSVGYDVDLKPMQKENVLLTGDLAEVKKHAPYDIILLHDVLDHIVLVDPITALKQVRSLCDHNTRVYVRNHPWSSRHGGHLYTQTNKAYLHLVLDDIELTRLGGWTCEPNVKVTKPMETYRYWFQESGFAINSETAIKTNVEPFFLRPSHLKDRLLANWGDINEMTANMEIEFVEYVAQIDKNSTISTI